MSQALEGLKWRYACKKFNPEKKVSEEDLKIIAESLRLTASSYGLQLWHFYFVSNDELRKEMLPHCWGQKQVVDSSHVLVMARKKDYSEADIQKLVKHTETIRSLPEGTLKDYAQFMKNNTLSLSESDTENWMQKQIYIALGNALTVLASMKIDSCPMEGFLPDKIDEILGLEKKGFKSVLLLPFGYRAEDDQAQNYETVRYPTEDVVSYIN